MPKPQVATNEDLIYYLHIPIHPIHLKTHGIRYVVHVRDRQTISALYRFLAAAARRMGCKNKIKHWKAVHDGARCGIRRVLLFTMGGRCDAGDSSSF